MSQRDHRHHPRLFSPLPRQRAVHRTKCILSSAYPKIPKSSSSDQSVATPYLGGMLKSELSMFEHMIRVDAWLTWVVNITFLTVRECCMIRRKGTHVVCCLPHCIELLQHWTLRISSLCPVHFQADPGKLPEPLPAWADKSR